MQWGRVWVRMEHKGTAMGGWHPGMWGAHVMGHGECGTGDGASMQWGLGHICSRIQRCPQLGVGCRGARGACTLGHEVGAMGAEMHVQGVVCITGSRNACVERTGCLWNGMRGCACSGAR